MTPHTLNYETKLLIDILPTQCRGRIEALGKQQENIIEIVMDYGRELEVRFPDGVTKFPDTIIGKDELREILNVLSSKGCSFGPDDRAGLNSTLHRISRIDNREGECIGLTLRVGQDHPSSIDLIRDFITDGKSLLIVGPPASGKSTLLRATAKYLSEEMRRRVIIVDTSNEVGGEGDIPHPAIGSSRRMQVPTKLTQAEIMIRAVENHNPNTIIIDEISEETEALAACTISQRGVQLIATAHGNTLQNILKNKPLWALVGGMNVVTVSDDVMQREQLETKTKQERKHDPPFEVLIEIVSFDEVRVYPDLKEVVDCVLDKGEAQPSIKRKMPNGIVLDIQQYKATKRVKVRKLPSDPLIDEWAPVVKKKRTYQSRGSR